MAAIRRKRSNKVPLNFVSRSRSCISVQREVIPVITALYHSSIGNSFSVEREDTSEEVFHDTLIETGVSNASEHTKRKEKLSEMWDSLQSCAIRVLTEGYGLPEVMCCCGEKATIRCLQCSPCSYFCPRCTNSVHTSSLIHHCPELWNVSNHNHFYGKVMYFY